MERVIVVEVLDATGAVRNRVRLDRWPALIGRAYSADVLLDDPYVSPEHARLVETADGDLEAEDAGSLNGLFTVDGTRVPRTTVTPGGYVRVGRTTLRFCPADLPVAPPLLDGRPPVQSLIDSPPLPQAQPAPAANAASAMLGPWMQRTTTAVAVCAVATVLFAFRAYLASYQRTATTDAISLVLGIWLVFVIWTAGWAFAGRVLANRARFLQHLAIALAAAAATEIVAELEAWSLFLFPGGEDYIQIGVVALYIVIFVALLAGHLTLVSPAAARRRWRIAGSVAAVGTAILAFSGSTESKKFSTKLTYPVQVRPIPERWIPAGSEADFISDAASLRQQVDSLASAH